MPINVTFSADHPDDLRRQIMDTFGLHDDTHVTACVNYAVARAAEGKSLVTSEAAGQIVAPTPAAEAPKRRGRPPKVETSAQPGPILAAIAEHQATGAPVTLPAGEAVIEQPIVLNSQPAISTTPEDRVNPDDEPEEEADGIEEMTDTPGAKLTVDDLRNAAGRINRALGNNPARAQELAGPAFVQHGVKSISTCPDDKLEVMVAALNAVAAKVESGEVK